MIRRQSIISGKLLEINFYPVFCDGRRYPTRAPKTKVSTEQQARYNRIKAQKKLIRLVNANFSSADLFIHITYKPACAPLDEKEARRDIVNYIRRVKRLRQKRVREFYDNKESNNDNLNFKNMGGLCQNEEIAALLSPLKYIYVIEKQVYKRGQRAGFANFHFHMFISGGLKRDEMEALWVKGVMVNARRFRPDVFGPQAAAKYVCKEPLGSKSFVCSKGLSKPQVLKPVDGAISRCVLERIAKFRVDDAEFWQAQNAGYRFINCLSRFNEYNGHWYVSVVMYRYPDTKDMQNFVFDTAWDEILW